MLLLLDWLEDVKKTENYGKTILKKYVILITCSIKILSTNEKRIYMELKFNLKSKEARVEDDIEDS